MQLPSIQSRRVPSIQPDDGIDYGEIHKKTFLDIAKGALRGALGGGLGIAAKGAIKGGIEMGNVEGKIGTKKTIDKLKKRIF